MVRGRKSETVVSQRISDDVKDTLKKRKYGLKPQHKSKKYSKKHAFKVAFYNEDYDFLEHLSLVRTFYKRKYNLGIRELELLFAIYPMNYFTQTDYFEIPKPFTYVRIHKMVKMGHIVLFAKGENSRLHVYTMSRSSKDLVRMFYKYLSGEKKIPVAAGINVNPMAMEKGTKIDKLRVELMKKINKLGAPESKKVLYEPFNRNRNASE